MLRKIDLRALMSVISVHAAEWCSFLQYVHVIVLGGRLEFPTNRLKDEGILAGILRGGLVLEDAALSRASTSSERISSTLFSSHWPDDMARFTMSLISEGSLLMRMDVSIPP